MEFVLVLFNTDRSLSLIISTQVFSLFILKYYLWVVFFLLYFLIAAYCEAHNQLWMWHYINKILLYYNKIYYFLQIMMIIINYYYIIFK